MEILQFLLSFLSNNSGASSLAPIIEKFKQNDFDVKKVLSSLSPDMILPLLSSFMNNFGEKKNPSSSHYEEEGLESICNFADRQIVERLNCYFSRE